MSRSLTVVAAALAALSLTTLSVQAQTAAAPAKKAVAKKPAAKAEPVPATNDNLNPAQLSIADRVLTGTAECEFKEKVDVEKIAGHTGNFKVTYNHKTYVMVPEETTTGAIRLVDLSGAVVWIQIPMKSMLMNQKEHHRLVDGCQEDEQRIAVQSMKNAGTNAGALAPNVAPPGTVDTSASAVHAATVNTVAPGSTVTTTTTTTTTVTPPPAVRNGAAAPTTAASGMWK
jgi:hypothetical protein